MVDDDAVMVPAMDSDSDGTPLGYHQLAVRQMMERDDQWSILLMHGTGVGKTYSCISIAEAAMGPFGGKTLVVAPEVTHTQYVDSVLESQRAVYMSGSKESVMERYDIVTYESLHTVSAEPGAYSCVILDEAHALRNQKGSVFESLVHVRDKVIVRPRRTKVVMATATPMYDRADNIFPLLGILAWNNGDARLEKRLAQKTVESLREACKFVSYIETGRGNFAEKRYPDDAVTARSPAARNTRTFFGQDVPREAADGSWVDALPFSFVTTKLTKKQGDTLRALVDDHDDHDNNDNNDDNDDNAPPARLLDAGKFANVLVPVGDARGGVEAMISVLDAHDRIEDVSPKTKSILDAVIRGPRPALVHSRFFARGILPVLHALESEGFVPAISGERGRFCKRPKPAAKQRGRGMTYAIVTSGREYGDRASMVTRLTRPGGKGVDVICITDKAGTGFDLTGIRQVHLMDPWFNVSKMLQVIGRAFRYRAHDHLPEKDRWCSVHAHAVTMPGDRAGEESPDVWMLRVAARKYAQVDKYVQIIRRGAVDCEIFRGRNGVDRCSTSAASKAATITPADLARQMSRGGGSEAFITNVSTILRKSLVIGKEYAVSDLVRITGVAKEVTGVLHAALGRLVWPNHFRNDADMFQLPDGRLAVSRKVYHPPAAMTFESVDTAVIDAKVYDLVRSAADVSAVACVVVAMTSVSEEHWSAVRTMINMDPAIQEAFAEAGVLVDGIILDPYSSRDDDGTVVRGLPVEAGKPAVEIRPVKFPLVAPFSDIPETLSLSPRATGIMARFGSPAPRGAKAAAFRNTVIRGKLERKKGGFAFKVLKRDGSKFGRECHTESVQMLGTVLGVAIDAAPAATAKRLAEKVLAGGGGDSSRINMCAVVAEALGAAGHLEVSLR